MRYAKINESIWMDTRFNTVSDSARLLYMYLLSCSKCNSIGVFQIGMGLLEDEFHHERDEIKSLIAELEKANLLRFRDGWIWFNKYLRWNEPTSPNHARHCASDLNDCVLRGAPKEAVCSFLGSVKTVMGNIWVQREGADGKKRSYLDEFKASLDLALVGEFVGGYDCLKKCIDEGKCGIVGSTSNQISSTSNQIGSASNKIQLQVQDNNNTSTKQDNTRLVGTCKKEEASEISLFCSDGMPLAVGQAAASLALSRLPQELWSKAINSAQKESLLHPVERSSAESWFHNYIRSYTA